MIIATFSYIAKSFIKVYFPSSNYYADQMISIMFIHIIGRSIGSISDNALNCNCFK